jgi:hypothetical protein
MLCNAVFEIATVLTSIAISDHPPVVGGEDHVVDGNWARWIFAVEKVRYGQVVSHQFLLGEN